MKPSLRNMVVLAVFLTASGCKIKTTSDNSGLSGTDDITSSYGGHANYRLLLVGHTGPEFDPNQDLLKPTQAEAAREQAGTGLRAAALKSLIPLMAQIKGQSSGTEADLMASLMALTDSARKTLKQELAQLLTSSSAQFPIVSEAWIIPWTDASEDIFYDANKISVSPTETANVLKALPGNDSFAKKLTEKVQTLRNKLYSEKNNPVFLLAARHFLFVAPGKTRLTIRLLIGLQPYAGDFDKEDPKVKFNKVVVPDIAQKGITAAVTFSVPIEGTEDPTISVAFGDFKGLEKGNFEMESNSVAKSAPRLEGKANKPGTGWIALNFAFKDLSLNLKTVQLDQMTTLVSPGLSIGKARWTVGGIHAESIDSAFQTEINNTIDSSIKGAIDKSNEQILDGMLSKDTIEFAFKKIFHRT